MPKEHDIPTPSLPDSAVIDTTSKGLPPDSGLALRDGLSTKRATECKRAAEAQSKKDAIDTEYLRLTWSFYLLILLAVLGLELGCMVHMTRTIGSDSPTILLTEAGNSLQAAYEDMRANTTSSGAHVNNMFALRTLTREMAIFKTVRATVFDVGQRAFVYELVLSVIAVAFLLTAGVVFAVHREHKFVRARGREFLACFITTGILLVLSVTMLAAVFLLKLSDFPTEVSPQTAAKLVSEKGKLQDLVFGVLTLVTLVVCLFFGSFTCRLHVIYVLFSGPVRRKKVNYFSTAWVNIVVALFATIPLIVWRYASDQGTGTRRWLTAGVWFMALFYFCDIIYYLVHSHVAHREFSDYHSNMRAVVSNIVLILALLIYQQVHTTSIVASLGYPAALRSMVLLNVFDMLNCACVQIWQAKRLPAVRPVQFGFTTLQSTSTLSRLGRQ